MSFWIFSPCIWGSFANTPYKWSKKIIDTIHVPAGCVITANLSNNQKSIGNHVKKAKAVSRGQHWNTPSTSGRLDVINENTKSICSIK